MRRMMGVLYRRVWMIERRMACRRVCIIVRRRRHVGMVMMCRKGMGMVCERA